MTPALRINEVPLHVREQLRYQYPDTKFINTKKYSNQTARCLNKAHAIHQSIFEADYCNRLFLEKVPYVTQFKIPMYVEGEFICNHYMDFAIFKSWRAADLRKKPIKFIETKGVATEAWTIKRNPVRALFKKIPYEIYFQRGR